MSSKISKFILSFVLITFSLNHVYSGNLNLKSNSSVIKIDSGANLNIENAVSASKGKIIRDSSGTIEGGSISFDEGKLEEEGSKINLSGTFTPGDSGKINLNGNQKFTGKGGKIVHSIRLSG